MTVFVIGCVKVPIVSEAALNSNICFQDKKQKRKQKTLSFKCSDTSAGHGGGTSDAIKEKQRAPVLKLTLESWKVNTGFSKVGCSEIIINLDKIKHVCNPS